MPTTTEISRLLGLQTKISMFFLQDSRVSITFICTGSADGVTGTTIFVLKGQRRNGIFTYEFLWSKGCALGSTILIT